MVYKGRSWALQPFWPTYLSSQDPVACLRLPERSNFLAAPWPCLWHPINLDLVQPRAPRLHTRSERAACGRWDPTRREEMHFAATASRDRLGFLGPSVKDNTWHASSGSVNYAGIWTLRQRGLAGFSLRIPVERGEVRASVSLHSAPSCYSGAEYLALVNIAQYTHGRELDGRKAQRAGADAESHWVVFFSQGEATIVHSEVFAQLRSTEYQPLNVDSPSGKRVQ
jgi:hypothetical protein